MRSVDREKPPPPKKKRTYNTRLIKRGRSYTVEAIADLYQIYPNVVRRWIKAGLPCIDTHKPQRVNGGELADFLNVRQSSRKRPCKPNEALCCKCRQARPFWENMVDLKIDHRNRLNITGLCAVCSTPTFRRGSISKIPEYQKIFDVQTEYEGHLSTCSNPSVKYHLERNGQP